MPARIPFLNRIWDNIRQCEHGNICPYCCWEWQKAKTSKRYGTITIYLATKGHRWTAQVHRIVWELHNKREIPDGFFGCHHCNNRTCCNPLHIYIGTHHQNMLDAKRDGLLIRRKTWGAEARARNQGSKSPFAKLHENIIPEICKRYEDGETVPQIAKSIGLHPSTLYSCLNNKSWKHIKKPVQIKYRPTKLTIEQTNEIRQLHAKGIRRAILARKYNVSWTHINRITKLKFYY